MRSSRWFFAAIAVVATIALTGCPMQTDDVIPTGVTVTAEGNSTTVQAGTELQFNAVVMPTEVSQGVTWSVSPETTGVSISNTGLLTVAEGAPGVPLVVRATADGHSTVFGMASVTVLPATVANITWAATAVGSPTTTAIDFTFSSDPTGLVATDITITSLGGSATRGNLTGSGTMRTLSVSGVSAGTVSVSINRDGIASGPQTVTLVVPGFEPTDITWNATAIGHPATTAIDFTFSSDPTGLVATDITITSLGGSATRGNLTGSGTTRSLSVSGVSAGTVSISINRDGIASGPQIVTLVVPGVEPPVEGQIPANIVGTWVNIFGGAIVLNADGSVSWTLSEGLEPLNTTFSVSGNDFTITIPSDEPTTGTFSQVGNMFTLNLWSEQFEFMRQGTWAATTVGYPRTTSIDLVFGGIPAGLELSDITITPGSGSATGVSLGTTGLTTRALEISNVSAGTVSISINSDGIDSAPQTVTLITPPPITWTATPVGSPITTSIGFTFSADPGGLNEFNITITPVTGSATRGYLFSTSWPNVGLTVSNVGGGDVLISIDSEGIDSQPQTVTLVGPARINWTARQAGSFIMFEFDSDPGELNAGDIIINSIEGSAITGGLSGTGTMRALEITNVTAGTVSVSINSDGIAYGPQTVSLVIPTEITWNASPVGTGTTTAIEFTFSADPGWLTAENITITPAAGFATPGALSGTGTTRTLAVSNVRAGAVSLSVSRLGIASAAQTVTLVAPDITWTAAPVGSPTTTSIRFDFASDPGTLAESNFTIVGGTGSATRGTLSGSGNTWTLSVSGVSAGEVSVYIDRVGIARGPQEVTLLWAPLPQLTGSVTITGTPQVGQTLTANTDNLGGSGAISFQWRRGNTNITGATGGTRVLAAADEGANISVIVTRAGHSGSVISNVLGPVAAAPPPADINWTATAGSTRAPDGAPAATAYINLIFPQNPAGLVATNISIAPGTGSAVRGNLEAGFGNNRRLYISNVRGGTVHITINRAGFSDVTRTVTLVGPTN